MNRFKTILSASLLTLALSSAVMAGDISGRTISRAGDISGQPISRPGDISGRPGDISGLQGALLGAFIGLLNTII